MEFSRDLSQFNVRYPLILRFSLTAFSVLHDALMVLVAVYAYRATPVSIAVSLGVLQYLWVAMLLVGGISGIIGALFRWTPVEITGCVLMSSGKITWAISLLSVYNMSPGSIVFAGFLCAGAFGTLWRAVSALIGLYLRLKD